MKVLATTIAGLCLLAGTASASDFMTYCQDPGTSKAGKLTLKLIAEDAKSFDCADMELYIRKDNRFSLYDKNLTDVKVISFFPHLREIWLASDKAINLSQIGSGTQITDLTIHAPVKSIPFIGSQLKNLDIGSAKNVDLNELARYSNLENLELFNSPTGSYAAISKLTNLRNLHIEWGNFSDIGLLSKLSKLESVDLSKNNLESLAGIENLKYLTSLNVAGNHIKDIAALTKLQELMWLDISYNPVTEFGPLSEMKSLTSLQLNGMGIKDIGFVSGLTSLKSIDLNDNDITDVTPLAAMTHLTNIELSKNLIKDISPLGRNESIESIDADDNFITALPKISINLRSLGLAGNAITSLEGIEAGDDNQLNFLDLSRNAIVSLKGIEILDYLAYLDISHNKIYSLDSLSGMKRLKRLNGNDNRIYKVEGIAELPSIEIVYLHRNEVASVTPLKDSNIEHLMLDDNLLGYKFKRYESNCPKKAKSRGVFEWCTTPIERSRGGGIVIGVEPAPTPL